MAAISAANLIGSMRTVAIVNFFGSAKTAWLADDKEFEDISMPQSALKSFLEFRKKNPDTPEQLAEYLDRKNFGLCCITDEIYPPALKKIPTPPAVLYYCGELQPFAERISIVGTRHNTDYGRQVALEFSRELAAAGATIVSGAAKGIDTFAHIGAMKAGRTVAVLGGGINFYYKNGNKKFFEEIAEKGLVISEFNPNLPPNTGTFPARNKIIAGLSRGVIAVEGDIDSGAFITLGYAKDFNRDVFAVPGNIFSHRSRGCNTWIANGDAILLSSAQYILDRYDFEYEKISIEKEKILPAVEKKIVMPELTEIEKKIFDIIPAEEYITVDEILDKIDEVAINEILDIMLSLDLKKYVVEDNGRYKRK